MYHCKSWMHPKKVELRSIKVKSHKYFHSPANPDSLLGSRQGEGANRVIAEREKRKIKAPHSICCPKDGITLRVHRELICLHTLPILACPYFHGKRSVFSRITAHALCLCLLNKKKGSPSTILMMDWWMKDACENSQHLFAPLSSQHAAPISHA